MTFLEKCTIFIQLSTGLNTEQISLMPLFHKRTKPRSCLRPLYHGQSVKKRYRDVVLTCVVLHSILRSQYQGQHGGQLPGDDDDVPGDGHLIGGAADCGRSRNCQRSQKTEG